MLGRLWIYLREMFPVHIYVPFTLLTFFGLFWATQALYGQEVFVNDWLAFVGAVTVFCLSLLMRLLDELKDTETDRQLFPHRPLPRGAVRMDDIRVLAVVVVLVMVGLNIWQGRVLVAFVVMMGYVWLSYKWFFLEGLIRPSLMWALVTHQPITFFVNVYVVAMGMYAIQAEVFDSRVLVAAGAFFFPVTAWETSRKIRAEGEETDYVTYSKLFGPRQAALLPLVSLGISFGLFTWLGVMIGLPSWFYGVLGALGVGAAIVFGRFIAAPTRKHLILKPTTEYITTVALLAMLIALWLRT